METHLFKPRFFRLPGLIVAAALVACVTGANVAHAAMPDPMTSPLAAIERSPWGNWAKSRILVAPNAGLSDDDFAGVLMTHSGKSLGKVRGLEVHVVELPANANEDAVAKALARNPHVKFAEVDRIVSASATTNDPILSQEWQISRIALRPPGTPRPGPASSWRCSTAACRATTRTCRRTSFPAGTFTTTIT